MTNHAKFTQICKIAIQPSSTSSSSNNETTIYNNFICKVKKYFINSSIIKLKYYNKITIFIIILCSLIGI